MARMLEGELVRLREVRRGDLDVIADNYNDPDVVRYLSFWDGPYGRDDAVEVFEKWRALPVPERPMAIARIEDDTYVGQCGLHNISARHRSAGFGVAIWSPDARGKGYGTEATWLLCDHAFQTLNLHRVQLSVFANNPRAMRCYEKVGFVQEGRRREAWWVDGGWVDIITMGVLRSDLRRPIA